MGQATVHDRSKIEKAQAELSTARAKIRMLTRQIEALKYVARVGVIAERLGRTRKQSLCILLVSGDSSNSDTAPHDLCLCAATQSTTTN